MKKQLCLALDVETREQALDLIQKTHDHISIYKLGPRLCLSHGKFLIKYIQSCSAAKIFLDFKFYDIPSSTLKAVQTVYDLGADFVTVHAQAGQQTLKLLSDFEQSVQKNRAFQILCVTVLSSVVHTQDVQKQILQLADQVYESKLKGLICPASSIQSIKKKYPNFFLVTPGIRFKTDELQDQKNIITAKQAFDLGSSVAILGRSIIAASSPEQALQRVLQSLK